MPNDDEKEIFKFIDYCNVHNFPIDFHKIRYWFYDDGLYYEDESLWKEYFGLICGCGYLETAKLFYEKFKEKLESHNCLSAGLRIACSTNFMDVVKWIYDIDNTVDLNEGFYMCCEFNNLELAKWIYEKKKDVINCEEIYFKTCINCVGEDPVWKNKPKRIEMVKWLLEIVKCSDEEKGEILERLDVERLTNGLKKIMPEYLYKVIIDILLDRKSDDKRLTVFSPVVKRKESSNDKKLSVLNFLLEDYELKLKDFDFEAFEMMKFLLYDCGWKETYPGRTWLIEKIKE